MHPNSFIALYLAIVLKIKLFCRKSILIACTVVQEKAFIIIKSLTLGPYNVLESTFEGCDVTQNEIVNDFYSRLQDIDVSTHRACCSLRFCI